MSIAEHLRQHISEGQLYIPEPVWTSKDFVRAPKEARLPEALVLDLPLIRPRDYVAQNHQETFVEFDRPGSQYSSELMRNDGCGICAVHMVNNTLAEDGYAISIQTVGELAQLAIALHRDDVRVGNIPVRRGTPVYNTTVGWYHDALLFASKRYAGIEPHRQEGLESLEQVAQECIDIREAGGDVLAVISVRNEYWRRPKERPSRATHLVVVNGFITDSNGKLKGIRVSDPYVDPNPDAPKDKNNEWLVVDDKVRDAFRGKAMYFVKP